MLMMVLVLMLRQGVSGWLTICDVRILYSNVSLYRLASLSSAYRRYKSLRIEKTVNMYITLSMEFLPLQYIWWYGR